jgi:hypothetical protein
MAETAEAPPTALARRFVRYVVGFGVGVGAATLVFLAGGLFEVIPDSVKRVALPASTLLMGLVAVGVQFYAREAIRRRTLRRLFTVGVLVLVAGVVLFLRLHVRYVETFEPRGETLTVVLSERRLTTSPCPCEPELSNEDCLLRLGLDSARLCWDEVRIEEVEFWLLLTYLLSTIGFGVLVGLVVVQEELRREARRRRRPKKPSSRRRMTADEEEAGAGGGG